MIEKRPYCNCKRKKLKRHVLHNRTCLRVHNGMAHYREDTKESQEVLHSLRTPSGNPLAVCGCTRKDTAGSSQYCPRLPPDTAQPRVRCCKHSTRMPPPAQSTLSSEKGLPLHWHAITPQESRNRHHLSSWRGGGARAAGRHLHLPPPPSVEHGSTVHQCWTSSWYARLHNFSPVSRSM